MISGILVPLSVQLHDDSLVPAANVDVSTGGGQFSMALHDHVHLILRGDQILELKTASHFGLQLVPPGKGLF